jgi:Zn-dependent protease with chaperone function
MKPIEELREFPALSPAAFQHPLDVQATKNLQQVPLLAPLLKIVSSTVFEKQMRLMSISGSVRLGPNQGRSIYEKFERAAEILDIPKLPEIYVSNEYIVNAYAYGLDNYQITLFSGLIDALTEEELLSVIGHELGHVKCEHMLYKTIAFILRAFGLEYFKRLLPAGTEALVIMPLKLAILQWERMAELSCDRASLLVVQDRELVASALSKLAGGSQKLLPEINLAEILKQAEEYDDSEAGLLEQIIKVNMMLLQTHPFPAVRVKEIWEWAESEQYQHILDGEYVHLKDSPALIVDEPVGRRCPGCRNIGPLSAATCLACGSSMRGGHLVCTTCCLRVFSGWQICPGCGSQLAVPVNEAATS